MDFAGNYEKQFEYPNSISYKRSSVCLLKVILPNIYYKMQELPLLTPTNFISNNKKRSRASIDDDFESHYLKKRLISTLPDLKPASTENSKYKLFTLCM